MASAEVTGPDLPYKLAFLPPGGENEVAEIRGVFVINTPIFTL